jgi:phage gp36-like protein
VPRFLTRTELDERWGAPRLLDLVRVGDGGHDEARIDQALTDAEAEAVSYLSGRYPDQLPTTPDATPPVLKARVADLALHQLRRLTGHRASDQELDAYLGAVRWLRDVQAGRANLDLPGAPAADRTRGDVLLAKLPGDAVFAEGGLDDW